MDTVRAALWTLTGVGIAFVDVALVVTSARPTALPLLVLAIAVEIAVAIVAHLAGRRAPHLWAWSTHTAARRAWLRVTRAIALVAYAIFLVGVAVLSLMDVPLASAIGRDLLAVGIAAAATCIVGALLEFSWRIDHAKAATRRGLRALYRTSRGAVYASPTRGGVEYVLSGPGGVTPLSAVQKQIDARAWKGGDLPTSEALTSALERWGDLEGSGSS